MRGRGWALAWLAPALALVAAGLLWPSFETLRLALGEPGGAARLAADPRLLNSLAFTLSFAVFSVGLELGLGLLLALALARPLPLAWLWRSCLLLPWALPSVVSSRLFAWLFHYQLGFVNQALEQAGLGLRVNWFAEAWSAWAALLAMELWKTTPLVALILLAGRQQVPGQVYEAAALDGAGSWSAFRHVTFPLIRPFLVVAGLFRLVDALRVFDSVWALTGGGPGQATESVSFYAHALHFRSFEPGYASWVSLGLLALVLAAAWAVARAGRFERDLREEGA